MIKSSGMDVRSDHKKEDPGNSLPAREERRRALEPHLQFSVECCYASQGTLSVPCEVLTYLVD